MPDGCCEELVTWSSSSRGDSPSGAGVGQIMTSRRAGQEGPLMLLYLPRANGESRSAAGGGRTSPSRPGAH